MESPTEVYSDEGLYIVREVFFFCSQNVAFELYIRGENVVGPSSIDFACMHAHSHFCSYRSISCSGGFRGRSRGAKKPPFQPEISLNVRN